MDEGRAREPARPGRPGPGAGLMPGVLGLGFGPAAGRLRDLRGSARGFVVLLACITLGVAMIAAVGILNAGVTSAFERDAARPARRRPRDRGGQPADPADQRARSSRCPKRGRVSEVAHAPARSLIAANGRSAPVTLKAVDAAYPLPVRRSSPPCRWPTPCASAAPWSSAPLLARLGAKLGDSLRSVTRPSPSPPWWCASPTAWAACSRFGPRVIVSDATLKAAKVLHRARWRATRTAGAARAAATPAASRRNCRPRRPRPVGARSPSGDVQPQVARLTDRLATFLTLAGLYGPVDRRPRHRRSRSKLISPAAPPAIATLKCLGATRRPGLRRSISPRSCCSRRLGLGARARPRRRPACWPARRSQPDGCSRSPLDITAEPGPLLLAAAAGPADRLDLRPAAARCQARAVPPAALFRSLVAPAARRPAASPTSP